MSESNIETVQPPARLYSQVQAVLDTVPVAGLATVNRDGSPWATALHFAHDGRYLYWFSSDNAVHSSNINRNPQVSLTIWLPDESQGLTGIYLQTKAERAADRSKAESAYASKFGAVPEAFAPYSVYRTPLGRIDPAKTTGQLWYMVGE